MTVSSSTTLRVRGLPQNRNRDEVLGLLERSLKTKPNDSGLEITSLAEDPYQVRKQMATLIFQKRAPLLFTASTTNQWSVNISDPDHGPESDVDQALTFDTHFRGLTTLSTPQPQSMEEAVDCVAVCGLGGHAFGSFKEKGTPYMWLRDSLPKDLPNLRVLLYGYESGLDGSDSIQNVSVIADSLVGHLKALRSPSKSIMRPLVIIAHSLGGLVVKQAIMKLGCGDESDKKQVESVVGMLFFGVPNRGMDIESLRSIVRNGLNRYLLESIGQYSDLLVSQDGRFGSIFSFKDSPIVSFFETKSSPTAINVEGSWKMAGPKKVLVNQFSATRPRLWESNDEPLDRTHSDLVKYSFHDPDYERVLSILRDIASKGTALLTSRYLHRESPDALNADEVACLQSLSFKDIYVRENIIETALEHTGSWLLESKDFDNWIRRSMMDEHRGFFWIQGNPGSGKSTLMKKVYTHVKACSPDPSTIIAAFFFNARGSEIEKSPTGLFRTLLHRLCQQISALRDLVVKAYVAKRQFSNFDVQWQLSELKELLATVVSPSVLGERKLLLLIDALDECDMAAIQSVVQAFEDLAGAALSESTNFNICLSSRYWPQIRIPNCLVARVELENQDDIGRYIQKHLGSAQINEEDLRLFATLKAEILVKAQGSFLWVVLIVQDLLHANIAGATLRELRDIVQKVPPDLSHFYRHQLQSVEGEDRERMLLLFRVVYYALRPLSPTELRYALAFGCEAYASYAEWSQSTEYVRSDEQMQKRVREHSKGLVEFALVRRDDEQSQDSAPSRRAVVQFVHQSFRDYLTTDGFACLRGPQWPTQDAKGHEFLKTACLNYLRAKELDFMSEVDFRVSEQAHRGRNRFNEMSSRERENLTCLGVVVDHPLLEYVVGYIFVHAAQAEQHGISQNGFRACMGGNIDGCFERWRYIHDIMYHWNDDIYNMYLGPEIRPIHIFARYGLLTKEIAEKEGNTDIVGGSLGSALFYACHGGHEDTVGLLLDLGADPTLLGLKAWRCAIDKDHVPILRRLLNHCGSNLTLPQRLSFIRAFEHSNAILDLLFPEATFSDSVFYDVCQAARLASPGVLLFLLDKSEESILHDERLWEQIFASSYTDLVIKVRLLLDRGGTIKVTATFIERVFLRARVIGEAVTLLLLEGCEVEITAALITALCQFTNSAQMISALESAGHRVNPFTPEQVLGALKYGSAESAAFFLQRINDSVNTDEVLSAALSNRYYGHEVTLLALNYLNPDHISEQGIIAALKNGRCGGELFRLLYSRWNSLTISEAALAAAVHAQDRNTVKFILQYCECARVSEIILFEATGNLKRQRAKILDLLLPHSPDLQVPESTVINVIHYSEHVIDTLDIFCKHAKSLPLTEDLVQATVDSDEGPNVLEFILHRNSHAKISSSMIMMAMQAEYGAALISVMLHHDHALVIKEEHLLAAASNNYEPNLIFELLQARGKLAHADPTSGSFSIDIAKRRKVSHKSRPRVSSRVIAAAMSNSVRPARNSLLKLFLKWEIITETKYKKCMSKP